MCETETSYIPFSEESFEQDTAMVASCGLPCLFSDSSSGAVISGKWLGRISRIHATAFAGADDMVFKSFVYFCPQFVGKATDGVGVGSPVYSLPYSGFDDRNLVS